MTTPVHREGAAPAAHHDRARATTTGPIGRLVRLALLALVGRGLLAIARHPASFQEPAVVETLDFWIYAGVSLLLAGDFAATALRRQWGQRPRVALVGLAGVVALVGLAGVAALASLAVSGSPWGPPLGWFLSATSLAAYAILLVAFALAVVLGTPGCEQAAFPALLARLRGHDDQHGVIRCGLGLHRLDRWEANRATRDQERPLERPAPGTSQKQ